MPKPPLLSLIIPVFNENEVLPVFIRKATAILDNLQDIEVELLFVNDGSTDGSLDTLINLKSKHKNIIIIDLSRNFGKEAALSAGLQHAKGDIAIPIDADLQDPPELIPVMVEKWREGYEVVHARRTDRGTDSIAKRTTAKWFYRIHNAVSDVTIPSNVGDYRLLSRPVIDAINNLCESQRFMKGIYSWVGFKGTVVDYTRQKRAAGESKFNGWKLWNYALEGLTSFGTVPLRIWTYIGAIVALVSFILSIKVLVQVFIFGIDVPGYASLMIAVCLIGGLQLIGIGMLGEYLGRTYIESKKRPVFVVREIIK